MTPKYGIIHQTILKQIQSGALNPNDPLPGEDELAKEYGASLITVRRAMTELKQDGAIVRVRGRGSFVKKPEGFCKDVTHKLFWFVCDKESKIYKVSYQKQ